MTTLRSKIDEILGILIDRIKKGGDFPNSEAHQTASKAILKEVYEEVERIIGKDEYHEGINNWEISRTEEARNKLRAEIKSNLKELIGKEDG